jgi:pimeloyl-ACP methyl ester carboxylesterase
MPLAQQFAARGVATLVYEKRPITRIGGEELTPGEDLAADALSAVEALARRPDIRPDRIGLWGGSQGSGVAALAASRSSRVAFVVSVSGGGTPYTPFALFQAGHRLRARNLPEATVTEALSAIRARHQYLRGQIDSASLAARLADERRAWERVGHQRGDAASVWRDVRVPVLAIWGGRDRLVPPRASAVAVGAALRGSGSSNNNVVCVVPNADHGMLLPGGPGVAADGGFAFPELARPYREGMLAWVREQSGLAPRRENAATFGTQGCVDPSTLPPDEGLPPDR